jgi:hypothetical protein
MLDILLGNQGSTKHHLFTNFSDISYFHSHLVPNIPVTMALVHNSSLQNYEERRDPPLKSPCRGVYRAHNIRISQRTLLNGDTITLQGWPSRDGIIVLENATPPGFDFLHLDPLDHPLQRHAEQALDPGALCVLACEKVIIGRTGNERLRPKHHGLVSLARTMDERCTVLQRIGGTLYTSIDEVQDRTFLKAWENNHQGEKGPLLKLEYFDPSIYGGHPDDALSTIQ